MKKSNTELKKEVDQLKQRLDGQKDVFALKEEVAVIILAAFVEYYARNAMGVLGGV